MIVDGRNRFSVVKLRHGLSHTIAIGHVEMVVTNVQYRVFAANVANCERNEASGAARSRVTCPKPQNDGCTYRVRAL